MIYFNNAATSWPKPPEVLEAVNEYLSGPPCHSARVGLEKESGDATQSCRERLCKLFNADDSARFVFTSGSTEALNLAINGLEMNNAHVVTTGIEHNSVIRPLMHLKNEGKIELTFVDCDETGYVSPEKIEAEVKEKTKAIVVNHCSNVTGSILDIKTIAEIAHKNGMPIIVDASQSAGAVDIDIKGWNIDLLAFTGHKSLYGTQGIGGLYIKEGIDLKPLKVGGTGIKSEVLVQPPGMPIFYEAGTPNVSGIVSINAGIGFVLKKGVKHIREHKAAMVKKIINGVKEFPEIAIYTTEKNNSMANFCFNVGGMAPEEVGYFLDSSYDIVVRTGLHCAPLLLEPLGVYPWGTVRASPSYFTTDEEIELFIKALIDAVKSFTKRK
ncbi:aminotransferase class V-fold PLP-dependent enzyme [Bacteroidota bacterium]